MLNLHIFFTVKSTFVDASIIRIFRVSAYEVIIFRCLDELQSSDQVPSEVTVLRPGKHGEWIGFHGDCYGIIIRWLYGMNIWDDYGIIMGWLYGMNIWDD